MKQELPIHRSKFVAILAAKNKLKLTGKQMSYTNVGNVYTFRPKDESNDAMYICLIEEK